jgi:hypothetical protein
MPVKKILPLSIILLIMVALFSCRHYVSNSFRQTYTDFDEVGDKDPARVPFFKIHFENGEVSVLEKWDLNEPRDTISGEGLLYDFNRNVIKEGALAFSVDEIAIVETNQLAAIQSKDQGRIAALSILTGANVALDIFCITNPKACFGSCPTFYVDENSDIHAANAEGFSSSTAPCLEKADLDPLQYSTASETFFLTMKNEAMETHMVNKLSLEAVLKNKDEKVYVDKNNNYYTSNQLYQPKAARVEKEDIKQNISAIDEQAYFSTTDSTDLFAQEEIILDFDQLPEGEYGIVLNYRQTLLTTFLFYTGLSLMGDEVGDFVAKMETNSFVRQMVINHFDHFGKIKISSWDAANNRWNFIEELDEKGPIAKNLILVPVSQQKPVNGKLKIKLELTKGLWRLDYLALSLIADKVEPVKISPSSIEVIDGADYTLEEVMNDDDSYLISFPGNEFKFKFDLPEMAENKNYELFLSSKGYYLEWVRQEWLKDKNTLKLNKVLLNDPQTWKELAQEFKTMEHEMETVFWNSKYSRIK